MRGEHAVAHRGGSSQAVGRWGWPAGGGSTGAAASSCPAGVASADGMQPAVPGEWVGEGLGGPAAADLICQGGATVEVALLCPLAFMTAGPAYRQRLVEGCMQDARLAVVSQPGQQHIWVVCFAAAGSLRATVVAHVVGHV